VAKLPGVANRNPLFGTHGHHVTVDRYATQQPDHIAAHIAEWNLRMLDPVLVRAVEAVARREVEPRLLRCFPGDQPATA
jgi:predicted GTPase